jgi:ABC-type Fe3+/spermidine/putrescine transport system ATPase subunit
MSLEVRNIHKAYGAEEVLKGVSLNLAPENTLAVLGQSGSGKTTLLKIIAGLEGLDKGQVFLNGNGITNMSPRQRGIVYLYQEALLFPHLDVFENIAFGLRLKKLPDAQVRTLVDAKLAALGLETHARKMPDQLSGGQRQRVNFGRALIVRPKLMLLDEPFGALDTITRTTMQNLYKAVAATENITSIFVTHDLKEALLMGDHFAYIDAGVFKTYGDKQAFIDAPETGVGEEREFWQGLR